MNDLENTSHVSSERTGAYIDRSSFADDLRSLCAGYRRRVFLYWSILLFIYGALSVVLLMAAGVLSGFSFAGLNLAASLILLGGIWFAVCLVRTLLAGRLGTGQVLRRWEREYPDIFDRLSAAQEFVTRREEVERLGYSPSLVEGTIRFAEGYIKRLVRHDSIRPPLDPALAVVAGLVVFGTVLAIALPGGRGTGQNLLRALNSLWRESPPAPAGEIVLSGPSRVPRGASAELSIVLSTDRNCILHVERRGRWEQIALEPARGGRIQYTIRQVLEPLGCLVTAGGLASRRLAVQPVDPPALQGITWTVSPPAYTRLPGSTLTQGLSGIVVPKGSMLKVSVLADQPLASAAWLLGGTRVPLLPTGREANGTAQILDSTSSAFEMANDLGMVSQSPAESLSVIPDRAPRAKIIAPGQTAVIDVSNRQEISVLAQDDYGLERALLRYEINYEEAQRATVQIWQAPDTVESPTQVVIGYEWNLEPLKLFPGDEVSYYIEVWDNDPFTDSKPGRSNVHILRSPSLADVYQDLFGEEEAHVETMSEIVEEQRSITNEVRDIAQTIREKEAQLKATQEQKESFFPEQQRLQELEERQKELQKELEILKQEVGKLADGDEQKVEEQAGLSMETLAKIERIRELIDQVISREGRELLNQLSEVVQKMSQEIDPSDVDALEFSFERFEEQLDLALSQLEAAYRVRQLEGLWQVAEQLAEREARLERDAQRLEEQQRESGRDAGTDEDLMREQAALQQRQEALNQDAESMLRAMERLAESVSADQPQLAQQLHEMAQAGRGEMSRSLQKAQQYLSRGQLPQARSAMREARDQLQDMAGRLQDQFAGLGGISLQFDLRRIRRLVDRGLYLSDRQERLVVSPLAAQEPKRSLELEVLYSQEAGRISQAWREIVADNPFADLSVMMLLDSAAAEMREAVSVSEGEEWISYGPAHAALRNINEAVAAMLKSMNSLQQQAAQASAESFMEQMRKLIQQQQQLNEQTDRLRSQQTQFDDLLSQLRRMAAEQARIRKEIENLMRRYRHMRNLQSRLDEVAKEMKEVEEQLEQARLDRELDEKQDRILTRMLEAQTSQEQDTYGRRRKAEQPTGQEGISSPPEDVETGVPTKYREVYGSSGSMFVPPRYRDLVKRYFRNLRERESS